MQKFPPHPWWACLFCTALPGCITACHQPAPNSRWLTFGYPQVAASLPELRGPTQGMFIRLPAWKLALARLLLRAIHLPARHLLTRSSSGTCLHGRSQRRPLGWASGASTLFCHRACQYHRESNQIGSAGCVGSVGKADKAHHPFIPEHAVLEEETVPKLNQRWVGGLVGWWVGCLVAWLLGCLVAW